MEKIFSSLIINGVLVSNIIFVALVIVFFVSDSLKKKIIDFVSKNIIYIIFAMSLLSVVGSLIYSNVLDFKPCVLCWWQRVLLYPQALISFVAIIRKEKQIIYYLLPLSVIGFIISLYQSYVGWGGGSVLPCTAGGGECSKIYVYEYGYITIPFMALSAFIYLIVASFVYRTYTSGKFLC